MQRKNEKLLRSDDEAIKEAGLVLDFDEIARKGSMTREEMNIAKWYGIYMSRTNCGHMARVVIPGGQLTSVQARALARINDKYASTPLSFTTRQAAQYHDLDTADLPHFLRDLHQAGLTTFHGCGDVNRNVAACPWASVCQYRRVDVLPWAKEAAERLAACRDLDNLPRKFKITFSGCRGGCGQPHINCVGITAVTRKGTDGAEETGFEVKIGGGLGWQAFIGQVAYSFVPQERIVDLCRAVAILFRDHGDRRVRMYARLKFVVHHKGIGASRALLEEIMDAEGVDHSAFETAAFEECGVPAPDRPLCDPEPVGTDGLVIQRIMLPKGEVSNAAYARIADLSEIYGDKYVYSTNRQNLEIHGVRPERAPALRAEIDKLDLRAEGFFGVQDMVACVGLKYCPLAVGTTHELFDSLQGIVDDVKYASIRDKVIINMTGCPNSCAQYSIADIGFRAMRIREEQGSVEAWQVILGGTEDRFGELLGEYKMSDCPRVVRAVLDTLLASNPAGRMSDHVRDVGLAPYRKAVAALGIGYVTAVNPLETSVHTGVGYTALDLKTIARDVPCQEACPAKTNVPEYIRHIAQGNLEAAHRINQEDNVFPNVLGRVCTRPCEDRCRYQWTSTRGAVQICHLKRAAADGKSGKSKPLPAWFGPTGKQVAIVGGGPAGLAAGRELRRFGHEVILFERANTLGGQILAIPEFRLPRAAAKEDIDAIVQTGIDVHLKHEVDHEELMQLSQDFDAVLLSAGTSKPHQLELEGLPSGLATEGLIFMKDYNRDILNSVEGDVVVIGGGFTAVDCARSARRLAKEGAKVSIVYRRGEAQMSASPEELHEIRAEGIHVDTLVSPVAARVEDGKLKSITLQRNLLLSEPDEGGKPRFEPIEQGEFEVPCDTLILAIGQTREPEILGETVEVFGDRHHTSVEGLFVAGDFSSGSGDVIHSAADGKTASDAIDEYLMGEKRRRTYVHIEEAERLDRTRDHDLIYPPKMPVSPLGDRGGNGEVELGFAAAAADEHAWRCYLCNHKFEIDQDKCIHCDWCIRVSPRDCIRRLSHLELDADGAPLSWTEVSASEAASTTYIWIDSDHCIRCGNCHNICPVDAISLRKCDRVTVNCPQSK